MGESTTREHGKVRWFKASKGYGFLSRNGDQQKDVFVHINNLPEGVNDLREGQAVSYDIEETRKGLRAIHVTLE